MKRLTLARLATKYLGWDVSAFLRSKKGREPVPYVMVYEADAYRIPTYPRFIINDLSIEDRGHPLSSTFKHDKEDQNIFNSSDFITINTAFGSIEPNNGKKLEVGNSLFFRGTEYSIVNIEITIADFFNDYSFTAFEKCIPHEGRALPYNIRIKIDVIRIDAS